MNSVCITAQTEFEPRLFDAMQNCSHVLFSDVDYVDSAGGVKEWWGGENKLFCSYFVTDLCESNVSVHPSIRLSHAGIVPKRTKRHDFFTIW